MRLRTVVIVGAVAVVAFALAIGGLILAARSGMGGFGGPERMVWDFRKGPHTIAEVNWPASVTGIDWDQKGDFDLTIIGGGGDVIFHERVQHIICRRKGPTLEDTFVHFGRGSTAEQAYQTAKKIMTEWQYPPESMSDLEVWHDAIKKGTSSVRFVEHHQKAHELFGDDYGIYPSFAVGKAGNVGLRISETGGGSPEKGNLSYTISIAF